MKILYLGTLEWGSNSLQRLEGLRALAEHVYDVDLRIFQGEYVTRSSWMRLQIRLGYGPLVSRLSSEIIREVSRYQPEVLWIDQGLCVPADTLSKIKKTSSVLLVHYTPDSLASPGFRNGRFTMALKEYDLCITNKSHEKELYYAMGARLVLVSYPGYDPRIHRPNDLDIQDYEKYNCDVAFIGQRMEARARSLCQLLNKVPCKLNLYGRKWEKGDTGAILGPYQRGWVYGDGYAKALCGAKIGLCFLNREVGDLYTTRTFEIPACGVFMLAERTDLHKELFAEDREAAYFDSDEELVDKVRFYLSHEVMRRRIAEAGYHKVKEYTWKARMRECVAVLKDIN